MRTWTGSARARESGVRTVLMRTAMVLGPGGALSKLMPTFLNKTSYLNSFENPFPSPV